jgi:hypothetical protein
VIITRDYPSFKDNYHWIHVRENLQETIGNPSISWGKTKVSGEDCPGKPIQ